MAHALRTHDLDDADLVERNLNGLWISCILDQLEAAGVHRAVACPGGRSAAMLLAMGRRAAFGEVLISVDERSGAYTALGMIKATGAPAAIVTTSGSAVANLVPALTEADECGLPLVVITCDRPRNLRHTGFGQMIDHLDACQSFVRASVDLPDPVDDAAAIAELKQSVARVLAQRNGPRPGPIHINIPFAGRYESTEPGAISPTAIREARRPAFFHASPIPEENQIDLLIDRLRLRSGMKGLIVAGPECAVPTAQLAEFAAQTGFPVLADTASGLRGSGLAHVLSGFDSLGAADSAGLGAPELVIRLGLAPVMPAVQDYLLAHPCLTVKISRTAQERDYLHPAYSALVNPSEAELQRLGAALACGNPLWRETWCAVAARGARLRRAVVERLPWGEVPAASEIFQHRGFEFLHLGNSMPIRHADFFYENRADRQPVYSNRGVWGIDGTLGTFLGEAAATGQSGLLVLGDLAFIHDLPALANAQRHRRPACVCVINNSGGAIFDFLPMSNLPDYRRAVSNPYQIDIGMAAAAFGLRYHRCENRAALREALDAAAAYDGFTIVEAAVPAGSAALGLQHIGLALRRG